MNYEFKDRRAIVTGASSGIGKGIALRFAKMGMKVVLSARRQEELEGVAAENTIPWRDGYCCPLRCDQSGRRNSRGANGCG
jgi:short-subunit dehydrogenase